MTISGEHHISEQTRKILSDYDVSFVFQPIYSRNDTIVAYEALMRPNGRFILEFIEDMKRENKLHELEILTFFGATQAYKDRGYDVMLSINSFPTEVFTPQELAEYTECFNMPREKVIVEILEYADGRNWTWSKKGEQINHNSGVRVALDDFGTGFNDEAAIEFYKPQYIKIDRSLISNIDKEEKKQSYLKTLVSELHKKDIYVLAEGVETKEELDFLKSISIDLFQGYYLGRPA